MEVLKAAAMYERYFQEVQSHAVEVARAEGRSWQDIAEAAAVTKQTAWAKWRGSKSEARETCRPCSGISRCNRRCGRRRCSTRWWCRAVESLVGDDDPIRDELLAAGRTALWPMRSLPTGTHRRPCPSRSSPRGGSGRP